MTYFWNINLRLSAQKIMSIGTGTEAEGRGNFCVHRKERTLDDCGNNTSALETRHYHRFHLSSDKLSESICYIPEQLTPFLP